MPGDAGDILRDSIARNAAAVLSLPAGGTLRHHKSRLLADAGDRFWIESVPSEHLLIDELIARGESVGISFKGGYSKIICSAPVLYRESEFPITGALRVEALLLGWPQELKAVQRRSNYRARVAPGGELSVRIWRIEKEASLHDQPMSVQELAAELCDVSVGGVGVNLLARDGHPPQISADDRLRLELALRDSRVVLQGQLRYAREIPSQAKMIRAGIQFIHQADDLTGRKALAALTKIVCEMHRAEVRRYRMAMFETMNSR